MLKLALLLALANAGQPRVEYTGGRCEVRAGDRCFTSTPQSPVPTKAFEMLLPAPLAPRVPACADGSEGPCVFCAIGAVDGGTGWQCVNEKGQSAGVVVDPGGPTYPSLIPGYKAREIDGTNFPVLYNDGGLLDTFSRDGGTIMIAGYSRGGAGGYDYWLTDNNSTGCFLLRNDHGVMTYQWGALTQPIDGFNALTSVNRNGWNDYVLRYTAGIDFGGGAAGTYLLNAGADQDRYEKVLAGTPGVDCASPWYFGARAAGDLYLSGPVIFYWFAPGARSDDWVANHTQALYNMPGNTGWLDRFISGLSYNTGLDNLDTTGEVDVLGSNTWLVNNRGLQGIDGFTTNYAGDDPLALDTAPTLGGAFVTANVSRGPLADYKQAAECDRITAPVAGAGVLTKDAGTGGATAWWNLSAYSKASDGGPDFNELHLELRSDGTWTGGAHSFGCDFTGMPYTVARRECKAQLTGGTYVVGLAAGKDAGTFEICQWQLTNSAAMEPPTVDGAQRTAGNQTYALLPTTCFGSFDGGPQGVEFVWTAPYDPNADWSTSSDVVYPLDLEQGGSYGIGDHSTVMAFGYTSPGTTLVTNRDGTTLCGTGACDYQFNPRSYIRGHTYVDRLETFPIPNSSKCTSDVREKDCGAMDAGLSGQALSDFLLNCNANNAPIIGTHSDVDGGCTAPEIWVTLGGRNASTVKSTNNSNALRCLQLK